MSEPKVPTVAIIGTGEMGAAVGRRLRECGATVRTSLRGRTSASAERVRAAGIEHVDDDDALVKDADFVLSIVPPSVAADVAEQFRHPIIRTGSRAIFAECNAVSPLTVRRIEQMLPGIPFIDAGIIGGPPREGSQDPAAGPRFYASGSRANELKVLGSFGLDIAVIDGPVGAASALKLAYAGLTKGFAALAASMIDAASRDGLDRILREELQRTQPHLLGRIDLFIPQTFRKAYRWVAEMEQIAQFTGGAAHGSEIYEGAAELFRAIAEEFERHGTDGALGDLAQFAKLKP